MKRYGSSLLRITFIAGLILFILSGSSLIFLYFAERTNGASMRQQDNFYRNLREYDISASLFTGTEREVNLLNRELDKLEKTAIGADSWLSVLKRRKALASLYPISRREYNESITRALNAYPMSQPIAAVAAAAIVKEGALDKNAEERLKKILPVLTDPSFNAILLGAHVLLGNFKSPQAASTLPDSLLSDGSENITVNLAILSVLRGDLRTASSYVQTLVNNTNMLSSDTITFAAEYHYDFGDPNRSAQLFSLLDGESALLRHADALYISGLYENARSLWSVLADSPEPNDRSLYNMAFTSENIEEAAKYYDKLFRLDSASASREAGIIRYSRHFDTTAALAILHNSKLNTQDHPYIDLELVRRQAQVQERGRQIAEAWLLLDRHGENSGLHNWAAWLISMQREYDELRILLDRIGNKYPWTVTYKAIQLMIDGDTESAMNFLRSIPDQTAPWYNLANRGRILEAQHSPSRAIEQYQLALMKHSMEVEGMNGAASNKAASYIEYRVAKCFLMMGSLNEAIRSLLNAIDYDPENITARLELDRLFIGTD